MLFFLWEIGVEEISPHSSHTPHIASIKGRPQPSPWVGLSKGPKDVLVCWWLQPKTKNARESRGYAIFSCFNLQLWNRRNEYQVNEGSSLHMDGQWKNAGKLRWKSQPNMDWARPTQPFLVPDKMKPSTALNLGQWVPEPSWDAAWSIRRLTVGRVVFLHFANYIEVGSIVPMCHRKTPIVCI